MSGASAPRTRPANQSTWAKQADFPAPPFGIRMSPSSGQAPAAHSWQSSKGFETDEEIRSDSRDRPARGIGMQARRAEGRRDREDVRQAGEECESAGSGS